MLTIRNEQMKALGDAMYAEQLVRISVTHLTELYTTELSHLPLEERRRRIEYGVRHALRLRFTDLGDILSYTEAALLLGCQFHADPACAWVHTLLADSEPSTLSERLRVVCARARIFPR